MTVLPFPAPERAIISPSLHARGGRPFVYPMRVDDYHAPGVRVKGGRTVAAVDAAWLIEAAANVPPVHRPPHWPSVPNVAQRAYELGERAGLYDYQKQGAAFLAERDYAFNLDQMGLGKSRQAIVAAEARLSMAVVPTEDTPVVLVLCPAVVKRHWQREIKAVTGHDAAILDGLRPHALPRTRYIICNYDILAGGRRRNASGVLGDVADLPGWKTTLSGRFLLAILDEVHILRGRKSRRSAIVKELLNSVPVVYGLSGTPMPNYVRDLWAIVDVVSNGLWGDYWPWARVYCAAYEGKYGWVDTGQDRLDELSKRMSFFMLGRSKDAVALQLPEKRREIFFVDVNADAPAIRGSIDELVTRQKLVMGGLRATARAKRQTVIDQTIEAIENKQRVIVFTYMREQAEKIAEGVKRGSPGTALFCVHGDLTPEGRDVQATNFRQACAANNPAVFVATVDSVGIGISLIGADLVIFGDLVPEPHKLLQAEARAHRIGSTARVLVRYLIAKGTIDEGIADRVIGKLANIEKALGKELDQSSLSEALGGRTDNSIIDELFESLRQWGARKGDDE